MQGKTKTILRRFRDCDDLIAIFPEDRCGGKCCQSYQIIGQHGAFHAKAIRNTVSASKDECGRLLRELAYIGYDVEIVGERLEGTFILEQWIASGKVGRDLQTATMEEIKAALSACHDELLMSPKHNGGRAHRMAGDVLDRFPSKE